MKQFQEEVYMVFVKEIEMDGYQQLKETMTGLKMNLSHMIVIVGFKQIEL